MAEEVQSEILTKAQVQDVVTETPPVVEEQSLPSETQEFEIPEKFKGKGQEDIIKAYLELESKLGRPPEETPPKKEPKPEVDEEYIAYKQQKAQEELLKDVGGVEVYKQALEWARTNMTEDEVKEYNEALTEVEGNTKATKLLAKGLMDRYNSNKGTVTTDPIHGGDTTKVVKTKGYATKSDMMKDMNDPRYEKDEGYRQQVANKLAQTDESNWYANIPRY